MVKLTKNRGVILVAAIFAIAIFGAFATGNVPFAVVSQPVGYLAPNFGSAECTVLIDDEFFGPWDAPKDEQDWFCGASDKGTFANVPQFVKRCEYQIQANFGAYITNQWKECDLDGTNCQELPAFVKGSAWRSATILEPDRKIVTEFSGFFTPGKPRLRAIADVYGLRVKHSDGFLEKEFKGCSISNLADKEILAKDKRAVGDTLPFDSSINWIGSSSLVFDSANIIIHKGQEIYVISKGSYYKVLPDLTADGLKVIDSRTIFSDPSIECKPEADFCNNDATLKEDFDPQGKECSTFRGVAPGWHISSDNLNEVCTLQCVSGFVQHDECKIIPDCEPGQILNSNYECITSGVGPVGCDADELPIGNSCVGFIWILVGAVVAIIGFFLVLIIIVMAVGKK